MFKDQQKKKQKLAVAQKELADYREMNSLADSVSNSLSPDAIEEIKQKLGESEAAVATLQAACARIKSK